MSSATPEGKDFDLSSGVVERRIYINWKWKLAGNENKPGGERLKPFALQSGGEGVFPGVARDGCGGDDDGKFTELMNRK